MDLAELLEIAEKERKRKKPLEIHCCVAASCISSNSQSVKDKLTEILTNQNMADKVEVVGVGCMGLCSKGPLLRNSQTGEFYCNVTLDNVEEVFKDIKGEKCKIEKISPDDPFYKKQMYIVLENSGKVDPESIESYIANGGYITLYQVLHEMNPQEVIDEITKSGLRGRGGAGYPTGLKWSLVAKSNAEKKFVVCNADEGDPGAFMDRSVLESDPHKIIEGMTIAAYAVGAQQGYIYIRGEYPLAISRLQTAIRQAKKYGLLGTQIFEANFDFKIDLRIGAGAFVCGEETALMQSIEGKRGTPYPRPPYPAEYGLWGYPTLINNVETFANVVPIIRNGSEWYSKIGTENSKGTKVFALAGKIKRTGLIEVPMGTTLREIVEEIGGGTPDGKKIKAVQTGGPSGGCIPASKLDTPVDYESLIELGSMMGSGGMIVMDEDTKMVEVAKFFMEFSKDESCGKCIPCRAGTFEIHNILSKILEGKATTAEFEKLKLLCQMVKETSLCGLGQSAPNPVLSTIMNFEEEYLSLLKEDI